MCIDIYDILEHPKGGTLYMDSLYTVIFWEDILEVKEHIKYFNTLTECEAFLNILKKRHWVVAAKIKWGDSLIKEYRRGTNAEEDDRK